MKKKQFIAVLLSAAMAATLLAGCGSGGETGQEQEDKPQVSGDFTKADEPIVYWSMWDAGSNSAVAIQEAIDAYCEASGNEVQVEWKGRDIQTIIGASIDAGEQIDIYEDDFQRLSTTFADYALSLDDMAEEYGYFDKWIYDIFFVAEIIISAAAFYAVFIILIRRKINYIITLDDQIKILETGDLNFDVTVKGNDELSSLAESLNQMRLSLAENIRKETEAVSANYNLVVSVSHDLRTPLTSLALYLDFIKNGKYKDENELRSYIEKCRKTPIVWKFSDACCESLHASNCNSGRFMGVGGDFADKQKRYDMKFSAKSTPRPLK